MDKNGNDNQTFNEKLTEAWAEEDLKADEENRKFRRRYFKGLGFSLIIAAIISIAFIIVLLGNEQNKAQINDKLHSPPYRNTAPMIFPDGTTDWKVIYDSYYHKAYYYCGIDKQWYDCYPIIPDATEGKG